MMLWIWARAFAGILGPKRGFAALADQAVDLAIEAANGVADQMGRLPGRFGEVLDLAGDHRKATSSGAGARRLDGGVQRQQIGLPCDRLDRSGYFGDFGERAADRTQAMLDTADRFDQLGDMLDRGLDHSARLGDFSDGSRGGGLHRLRRAGDAVIGGDHRFGGFLQMTEPSDWPETRPATSWRLPATSASSTPRPPIRLASWSTSRSLADGAAWA